eukprot:Hpha_TRINITY_DN16473_c1_g1::TRINITY_DN16473_c1_g1_i10::g.163527::m.163527
MPGSKSPTGSPFSKVAGILENVSAANEDCAHKHQFGSPEADFDCVSVPAISVTDWMTKLKPCAGDDTTFVVAIILIDRLLRRHDMFLGPFNVHRLSVTALLVATKRSSENGNSLNKVFAKKCRLPLENLNTMERTFLNMINWDIGISQSDYADTVDALPRRLGLTEFASMVGNSMLGCDEEQGMHVLVHRPTPPAGRSGRRGSSFPRSFSSRPTSPTTEDPGSSGRTERLGNLGRIEDALSWSLFSKKDSTTPRTPPNESPHGSSFLTPCPPPK